MSKYGHKVSHLFASNGAKHMEKRFQIWKENFKMVQQHNRNSLKTYQLEMNEFAAETFEEFKKRMGLDSVLLPQYCSATAAATRTRKSKKATKFNTKDYPTYVDWRQKGVVTPVKNQGHCGSCWTFSTTGAMESHWAIKTGNLISLSEQQLVDCGGLTGGQGCSGGLPSSAFEYIRLVGGLEAEEDYPYLAQNSTCKFDKNKARVFTSGSYNITEGDESEIVDAVVNQGPVSIAYQVVADFRLDKNGVYNSTNCKSGPMDVNHAVLVVGYGTTKEGLDYWIVKNSWSNEFGMEGYFWISRGKNMCGVATCAAYPVM